MRGRVEDVNTIRGMVAIATEEGYSIMEMLGDDPPDLGDEISWPGSTPLGGETVHNLTQQVSYEVYFQNHHIPRSQVRSQLLLR